MPYVRIVDPNPALPHQIILAMSQSQRNFLVSCNCMVSTDGSGHKRQLAEVPQSEMGGLSGSEATKFLIRVWREAHSPALDAETVGEALAYRWVWVGLGPSDGDRG